MVKFRILSILFILAFAGVLVRLFYWQVVKANGLSTEARLQHESQTFIGAQRGNILASDGSWLAASTNLYELYASLPNIKEDPKKIADTLAPLLASDPTDHTELLGESNRLYSLLSKKGVVWVSLKHQVANQTMKNIDGLKISGLGFDKEEGRSYPEASIAAQLLGFVGKDNNGSDIGYFGLEGYYDLALSGKPGFQIRQNDAKGIPIAFGDSQNVAAVSGVDLTTNIDKTIQFAADARLKEGIEKYGASGGTVTVMRPSDGAILAMESYPSFDPATYSKFSNDLFKNPVISNTFEPGSIFKTIVMASALDAKVVQPDTECEICSGAFQVAQYSIKTWNDKYFPNSSMTDVIVHSDNVGMVYVGQKLGADNLYDYLDKFGFGHLTGIDLQGEASLNLRKKGTWSDVDAATTTFGQGIAVTPIQMVRAVGAIANDGVLVTPQVISKLSRDGWSQDIKPIINGRIISSEAASQITEMMVQAASRGESKWTAIPGFSVAAKTGTAQIPVSGHYDLTNTIASFIGFAPANKPKFVMLVTLNSPQSSQWASETAAPLWYSIARDIFPYLGIQPD